MIGADAHHYFKADDLMSMFFRVFIAVAALSLYSFSAVASTIKVGQPLPAVQLLNLGECIIKEHKAIFQPWRSEALYGKISIVEYAAARVGIDKIQADFYAAIARADFPADKVSIVKLINSNDTMWGTSSMVPAEIKKQKLANPEHGFIVDATGEGLKTWGLEKKQSYIVILNASGNVLLDTEAADLVLNANVTSTAGHISLNAAQDVLLNATLNTTGTDKTVDVLAAHDITMTDGARYMRSNRNFRITFNCSQISGENCTIARPAARISLTD
mgnify:CR=1 FL=1